MKMFLLICILFASTAWAEGLRLLDVAMVKYDQRTGQTTITRPEDGQYYSTVENCTSQLPNGSFVFDSETEVVFVYERGHFQWNHVQYFNWAIRYKGHCDMHRLYGVQVEVGPKANQGSPLADWWEGGRVSQFGDFWAIHGAVLLGQPRSNSYSLWVKPFYTNLWASQWYRQNIEEVDALFPYLVVHVRPVYDWPDRADTLWVDTDYLRDCAWSYYASDTTAQSDGPFWPPLPDRPLDEVIWPDTTGQGDLIQPMQYSFDSDIYIHGSQDWVEPSGMVSLRGGDFFGSLTNAQSFGQRSVTVNVPLGSGTDHFIVTTEGGEEITVPIVVPEPIYPVKGNQQ